MEVQRKLGIDWDQKKKLGIDSAEEWWDSTEEASEDESEFCGLLKLFGDDAFGYDVLNVPLIVTPSESRAARHDVVETDEVETDDEMTEEQERLYSEQVTRSGGFDVEGIPGVMTYGQICPVTIDKEERFYNYDFCSRLAVDEYKRRFKDEGRELQFVKVLKVMAQVISGATFYITFEAKDLANGDKISIYQAVATLGFKNDITVDAFRLKPPQDEQGKVDMLHSEVKTLQRSDF